MIKRIIPVLVICSVLISAICFPAAAYDFGDFEVNGELYGCELYTEPVTVDVSYYPGDMDLFPCWWSEPFVPTFCADEQEMLFWALFGEPDYVANIDIVFNGEIYRNVETDWETYFGNPVLIYGEAVKEHSGLFPGDNGLPFLVKLTANGFRLWTDNITGPCTVEMYFGYVPEVEPIDYNDYTDDVVLSGDLMNVMVTLPSSFSASYIQSSAENDLLATRYVGGSFSHDFKGVAGVDHFVKVYPFGWCFPASNFVYCGKALRLDNIPKDSRLRLKFRFEMDSNLNWMYEPEEEVDTDDFRFHIAQIADPGVIVNLQEDVYEVTKLYTQDGRSVMEVVCTYDIRDVHEDAKYLAFSAGFGVGVQAGDSGVVDFRVEDFELIMTLSGLAGQAVQTQQTNKLLKEVNRQLVEQGKTLNEVLSGSSGMQQEADKITGDIANKVQQGNQLMDSLDAVDRPILSGMLSVPGNFSGQLPMYLSSIVRDFGETDLVYQMLTMAGLVMLASYILFGKKV